jgi:hypothetical protein
VGSIHCGGDIMTTANAITDDSGRLLTIRNGSVGRPISSDQLGDSYISKREQATTRVYGDITLHELILARSTPNSLDMVARKLIDKGHSPFTEVHITKRGNTWKLQMKTADVYLRGTQYTIIKRV